MRIFGFEVSKAAAGNIVPTQPHDRGAWWFNVGATVHEPFTGAWQRNLELKPETALAFSAVFSCVTLIASDVAKLGLRIVEQDANGIWSPKEVPAFSPVLRKPNRYQTRIKFIENWMCSKLTRGNTYVLKGRDQRGVVVAMYVLDPGRCKPLVAPDGGIYYELKTDNLAGLPDQVMVPASEIIHDTMTCLYHPLCGVSPIAACAMAAVQGLNIQRNSQQFFQNGSNPGGIITAPGKISDVQAQRIKDYWESNYTGNNVGKVAVLGDGLTYSTVAVNAENSQLIDQLKWSAETVCSAFHVPPYKIGVGQIPQVTNVEAMNQEYYSQCLQIHIEAIELLLDEELGLLEAAQTYGTEFDLDDLLRMDTATKGKTWGELVKMAIASPNEARLRFNLPPVKGGNSPMIQQQNFSLEALDKRDSKEDPFATNAPAPAPAAKPDDEDDEDDDEGVASERTVALIALAAHELKLRLTWPGHFQ